MATLSRRIGLGIAARGSVTDVISWAQDARARGLESIWIHDSYFERDAVTYASAVASHVSDLHVGLGALNPFTRHPVVVAMTVSALDEMAPGRIALALGTGLPLRLGQMGIPYTPPDGIQRVERCIADLRVLWRGDRLPPGREGLPPLQPMFPPVHRVPIYIAAYRTPMVELAGRVADGYLARPAESLQGFTRIVSTLRAAAQVAGRDPGEIETAGYLLTLLEDSRRDALNRAKREPFVIYMMSILSDVSLRQAGFEPGLRDRIAEAWRKEDYHRAAELIPDDLLEAFILCGTVDEVAERAAVYHKAGMDVPLMQPVVQDDRQIDLCLEAAQSYGRDRAVALAGNTRPSAQETEPGRPASLRRLRAWAEIARPFSFTASAVPVATGAALAALAGDFSWGLFVAALFAAILLQLGTNVVNEIYDVRQGVDSIVSPRASHAIVKGAVTEREAFGLAFASFAAAVVLGVVLIAFRGWPIAVFGILGLVGGLGYTAPPLQYKYKALGVPLVFALMGPVMVVGSYFASSGSFGWQPVIAAIPIGLLVAAILHGNEWRDISEDARAGIQTLSIRLGRKLAHYGYVSLIIGAYLSLALSVMTGVIPDWSLLAMLSLPFLVRIIRDAELGATGQQRAIAMIDLQTARLHASFGLLLVVGLLIANAVG